MGIGARRMFGWAVGDAPVRAADWQGVRRERASELRVLGRGRIDLELRESLGSGEIEGGGLVEVEFGLGRAACGRDEAGPMRQIKMAEDAPDGGVKRDERDDAHLTATDGTQEPEHLVDPGQELRPEHAAGSRSRRSCQGAGRCRLLGVARRSDGGGGRAGRGWGLCIDRDVIGHRPSDRDHRGSQACVGRLPGVGLYLGKVRRDLP